MKKCTYCGKELGDELDICPFDNNPLQSIAERQDQAVGNRNVTQFEGIGLLEVTPSANALLVLCNIFGGICIFIGITLCVPCLKVTLSHTEHTNLDIILGAVGLIVFVGGGASFSGLQSLVKMRMYRLGDWYRQLEHCANAEKHDVAKEAAHRLLGLTGTDLTTSKLKAKAHLYLGYYQTADLGAGHWEPLITLLNAILEQEPDNAVFRLDRGQAYHKIGKYDEALRDLEPLAANTEHPNARAHSLMISCLTALNRLDEAKCACANLETLRSRFPDNTVITDALAAHKAEIDAKVQQQAVSKPVTPNA